MQNDRDEIIGDYVPRRCSATGQIIHSKDHASVQINVGEVNEDGVFTGNYKQYVLCGSVRRLAESDDSLNRLTTYDGILEHVWKYDR